MSFNARSIKMLQPAPRWVSQDYPGLRLEVFDDGRPSTYRYKSPVDGRMRQIKIGSWPAMAIHLAIVTWEARRDGRAVGAISRHISNVLERLDCPARLFNL